MARSCVQPGMVLRPGMVRDFIVLAEDKKNDAIQLSLAQFERDVLWHRMKVMQEEDITMTGTIVYANYGGVMVDVFGLRGFVPNSHISGFHSSDKEDMIGTELELKLLEVDEDDSMLMLSARRVETADTFINFKIGAVVEGVVSKVMEYGAFIEVPPSGTGLLHISQVSHDRVSNIDDILSVGDRLKVPCLPELQSVSVCFV
jgi:small subunit ribosomal protein S1